MQVRTLVSRLIWNKNDRLRSTFNHFKLIVAKIIQSQLPTGYIKYKLIKMTNFGHFWLNMIEIHEKSRI